MAALRLRRDVLASSSTAFGGGEGVGVVMALARFGSDTPPKTCASWKRSAEMAPVFRFDDFLDFDLIVGDVADVGLVGVVSRVTSRCAAEKVKRRVGLYSV